jgi:hypothetical protein
MKYANAAALRTALDQRLVTEANTSRTDIARLRRRVTFERLLVRFALAGADRWVLKGGAAVEMRIADKARTTKDLDLAARHTGANDADVREALVDALLSDPQGDFFEFRLDKFTAMGIDGAIGPVWRASVDCRLDGRTFDHVVIDIVVRTSEVQRTEPIPSWEHSRSPTSQPSRSWRSICNNTSPRSCTPWFAATATARPAESRTSPI